MLSDGLVGPAGVATDINLRSTVAQHTMLEAVARSCCSSRYTRVEPDIARPSRVALKVWHQCTGHLVLLTRGGEGSFEVKT